MYNHSFRESDEAFEHPQSLLFSECGKIEVLERVENQVLGIAHDPFRSIVIKIDRVAILVLDGNLDQPVIGIIAVLVGERIHKRNKIRIRTGKGIFNIVPVPILIGIIVISQLEENGILLLLFDLDQTLHDCFGKRQRLQLVAVLLDNSIRGGSRIHFNLCDLMIQYHQIHIKFTLYRGDSTYK